MRSCFACTDNVPSTPAAVNITVGTETARISGRGLDVSLEYVTTVSFASPLAVAPIIPFVRRAVVRWPEDAASSIRWEIATALNEDWWTLPSEMME